MKVVLIRNAKSYDFGGGERFPVFAADILKRNGYDPIIISGSQKLREFATSHDIPVIKGWWWSHQNWSGAYALLFPVYFIWQLILSFWYFTAFLHHKPDVIHIQSKDDFIAATIAGRLARKRIIWTDHADLKHVWMNLSVWYKNPIGKLIYLCAHLAHGISVVSKSERELVTSNLSSRSRVLDKIYVIYNGVLDSSGEFSSASKGNMLTYCVASRLVTDKGIKEVIEAYKTIRAEITDSQLLLLGDGPEAPIFRELAIDVPSIKFLGHQTNPLKIMSQADIFVHPTYHEGFSVALVEAGMLGLPIIATAVGGNPEIIKDMKTGILVPIRDSSSLAEAMRKLAFDKGLRRQLGESARQQYVDKFQFNHIISESFIPLYVGKPI